MRVRASLYPADPVIGSIDVVSASWVRGDLSLHNMPETIHYGCGGQVYVDVLSINLVVVTLGDGAVSL